MASVCGIIHVFLYVYVCVGGGEGCVYFPSVSMIVYKSISVYVCVFGWVCGFQCVWVSGFRCGYNGIYIHVYLFMNMQGCVLVFVCMCVCVLFGGKQVFPL